MSNRYILLGLVLLAAAHVSAGRPAVKSPEVQRALAEHERALRDAEQAYQTAAIAAYEKYGQSLTAALEEAMQKKDLDQANQIKALADANQSAIQELKAAQRPPRGLSNAAAAFAGKWRRVDGSADWTMTLNAKEMSTATTYHEWLGTWAVVDAHRIRVSVFKTNSEGVELRLSEDGKQLTGSNDKERIRFVRAE